MTETQHQQDDLDRQQAELERAQFERDRFQRELDRWRADGAGDERIAVQQAALDRAQAAADRLRAAMDRRQAAIYQARPDTDELTGALRRDVGIWRVIEEVERARRCDTALTVAFVKIDDLGNVNEAQGRPAGDTLLQAVGWSLQAGLRVYDLVIRFGGGQFVCGLPGAGCDHAKMRFTEISLDLRQRAADELVSVGYAELEEGDTASSLIKRAEADIATGWKPDPPSGGDRNPLDTAL